MLFSAPCPPLSEEKAQGSPLCLCSAEQWGPERGVPRLVSLGVPSCSEDTLWVVWLPVLHLSACLVHSASNDLLTKPLSPDSPPIND